MPVVSVIIVCYRCADLLRECLASLSLTPTDLEREIIIVDNDPELSNTCRNVAELYGALYILSPDNIGFGRACNLGAQAAHGQYLLFLNPDTCFQGNPLSPMLVILKKDPNVGAVGARLVDENGHEIPSGARFMTLKSMWSDFLSGCLRTLRIRSPKRSFNYDFAFGASLLIRRKDFQSVGGFDPRFFMYCEEEDLQKRLRDMGKQSIICSKAIVTHRSAGTFRESQGLSPYRFMLWQKSRVAYARKYYGKFHLFLWGLSNLCVIFPLVIRQPWANKEKLNALRIITGRANFF